MISGGPHRLEEVADLAVEPKIYPAVRSWLESDPPGHNVNVT